MTKETANDLRNGDQIEICGVTRVIDNVDVELEQIGSRQSWRVFFTYIEDDTECSSSIARNTRIDQVDEIIYVSLGVTRE